MGNGSVKPPGEAGTSLGLEATTRPTNTGVHFEGVPAQLELGFSPQLDAKKLGSLRGSESTPGGVLEYFKTLDLPADLPSQSLKEQFHALRDCGEALQSTSRQRLSDAKRVDKYGHLLLAYGQLRQRAQQSQTLYTSNELDPEQVSKQMEWVIDRILEPLQGQVENEAVVETFLKSLLDTSIRPVPNFQQFLSFKGLQQYATDVKVLKQDQQNALKASGEEKQTKLFQVLTQAVNLGQPSVVDEVLEVLEQEIQTKSHQEQLIASVFLMSALKGTGFVSELRVKARGVDLAKALIQQTEEMDSGAALEVLCLVKGFYEASGDSQGLEELLPLLAAERDNLRLNFQMEAQEASSKSRLELAALLVQTDQALLRYDQIHGLAIAGGKPYLESKKYVLEDLSIGIKQLAKELKQSPKLSLEEQIQYFRLLSVAVGQYKTLTKGEKALLDGAKLSAMRRQLKGLAQGIFSRHVQNAFQKGLIQDQAQQLVLSDLMERYSLALTQGEVAFLSQLSVGSIEKFAQLSEAANGHLGMALQQEEQDSSIEQSLDLRQKAAGAFISLGLPEKVKASLGPLVDHGLQIPQPVEQASFLLQLGQIYQEGGMTTEANQVYGKIIKLNEKYLLGQIYQAGGLTAEYEKNIKLNETSLLLNEPVGIQLDQLAKLASGLQALNNKRWDRAKKLFSKLPKDPVIIQTLQVITQLSLAKRVETATAVLQQLMLQQGEETPNHQEEIQRSLASFYQLVGQGTGLHQAICQVPGLREVYLTSQTGFALQDFIQRTEGKSQREISEASLGLAQTLRLNPYQDFGSAFAISHHLSTDRHVGTEASYLVETGLPRSIANEGLGRMIKLLAMMSVRPERAGLYLGAFITGSSSHAELMDNLRMAPELLLPFMVARRFGTAAKTWITTKAEAAEMSMSLLARPWAARSAAWGASTVSEATGFALGEASFVAAWDRTLEPFAPQHLLTTFGSMLITFGLVHIAAYPFRQMHQTALRYLVEKPNLRDALLAKTAEVLGWGARVHGFAAATFINEEIGLHESQGNIGYVSRLAAAGFMDWQMMKAGQLINSAYGGALAKAERASEQRLYKLERAWERKHGTSSPIDPLFDGFTEGLGILVGDRQTASTLIILLAAMTGFDASSGNGRDGGLPGGRGDSKKGSGFRPKRPENDTEGPSKVTSNEGRTIPSPPPPEVELRVVDGALKGDPTAVRELQQLTKQPGPFSDAPPAPSDKPPSGVRKTSPDKASELGTTADLLDKVAAPIVVVDRDGKIRWLNENAKNILGVSTAEELGPFAEVLEAVSGNSDVFKSPNNPNLRWHLSKTDPINGGEARVYFFEDQTASAQVARYEQAMQRLRAGLHDINNKMAGLAIVDMASRALQGNEGVVEKVKNAGRYLGSLAGTVRTVMGGLAKLRSLAHGLEEAVHFEKIGFSDLIDSAAENTIKGRVNKQQITLEWNTAPGLESIFCDPQKMGSVFENLFRNASDAMPDGGKITVSIGTGQHEGKSAIIIEVSDTGTGIPKAQLRQIFEYKFTTKGDQGDGLGLWSVKETVEKAHGGKVEVESTEGEGTTFKLFLPKNPNLVEGPESSD